MTYKIQSLRDTVSCRSYLYRLDLARIDLANNGPSGGVSDGEHKDHHDDDPATNAGSRMNII